EIVFVLAQKIAEHVKSITHVSRAHFSTGNHEPNDATNKFEIGTGGAIIPPPHSRLVFHPFRRRSGAMKKTTTLFAAALFLFTAISAFGREARLVRYPHYHNGRIVFSYLGDIWTADE